MTATSTARRNSQRRIRAPPARKANLSFESYKSGLSMGPDACSLLFHDQDDISQYQYSIDPSLFTTTNTRQVPENAVLKATSIAAGQFDDDQNTIDERSLYTTRRNSLRNLFSAEVDQQTIDEKSLYTTTRRPATTQTSSNHQSKVDWEDMRIRIAWERKRRMMVAGQDNSIPRMIVSPSYQAQATSKLSNMNSLRSILSFDPTEEESHETTEMPTETTSRVEESPVSPTDEDEATLYPEPRRASKRPSLVLRLWKSIFTAKKEKHLHRQPKHMKGESAPAWTTPSELYDSIDVRKKTRHSEPAKKLKKTRQKTSARGLRRWTRRSAPERWAPQQAGQPTGGVELRAQHRVRGWKRSTLAEC